MSMSKPSFSINVDVTNPGQFFACCGLLELAHRLWPGMEGCFDKGKFSIFSHDPQQGCLSALLKSLCNVKWKADEERGVKSIYPLQCEEMRLQLDWWLRSDWHRFKGKPKSQQTSLMSTHLKLWAGNQTSLQIATKLTDALAETDLSLPEELLNLSMPLTGRYGFDPRAAWNALDVGFSPNDQSMTVSTYPAVEILAAIGLQRFRPVAKSGKDLNYAVWHVPLSPLVAACVCAASIPAPFVQRWCFCIVDRGSYKGFNFATPIGDIS